MAETFTLQLSKFVEKAKIAPETVARKAALDLFAQVVERTPVGNPELWAVNVTRKAKGLPLYKPAGYVGGRARASWNASIGSPNMSVTTGRDATGEATKDKIRAQISSDLNGRDIWLMSNLPYIRVLEYGHSGQSPSGMVRVSVTQWQDHIAQAVRELPK